MEDNKEKEENYIECPKCERRVKKEEKICPYCKYDLENRPKIKGKAFYQKWWFWIAILIIVVVISLGLDNINATYNVTSSKTINNTTNNTKNSVANKTTEEARKNPYEVINDYDGIYSFLLLDNNRTGVDFDSVGALKINNGNCEIKYTIIKKDKEGKEYYENVDKYTGFAGKNKSDNEEFYITLKLGALEDVTYKCKFSDNKFLCELISEYNLSGCSQQKNLELIKINEASNIDLICNQKLEEEKARRKEEKSKKVEEKKQAFIASCQSYTFEQMARNPDNFKGTNVKVTGEVVQVMSDSYSTNLRVNITKKRYIFNILYRYYICCILPQSRRRQNT